MVNKNIIVTLFVTAAAAVPQTGAAQKAAYNTPGAGNPILPGYFADPTIKKFGDTYYIYATTDGSGAGFGPAQLWCSKDFKNWTLMPMNWPDSHWIWAPDVMKNEADGKYYYLYCQPCKLHLGMGDTPRGPWKNVLGESEAVLVPDRFVKNAITLDGQTFRDDDGSVYMYWGTWGIYKGFGCGAGKLNPEMKSFSETKLIPNTEVTHFFEAPFVFKRNGIYYFLYSCEHCEDASYRVDYATAKSPLGPYTYHGTILKTNADGTVHGPGHNSVLQEGDNYYIVYHRHDNPHSNRGFHRQVAIDKLEFNADGTIKEVVPTHEGLDLKPEMKVLRISPSEPKLPHPLIMTMISVRNMRLMTTTEHSGALAPPDQLGFRLTWARSRASRASGLSLNTEPSSISISSRHRMMASTGRPSPTSDRIVWLVHQW